MDGRLGRRWLGWLGRQSRPIGDPGHPGVSPWLTGPGVKVTGDQSTVGTFGRFHVVKQLGAGGMGVVYEAYDPDLARGVALKLVNVTVKDRETALAEAKALARLSHPNVVPIYDVGLEGERVYLVMELVRGNTLRLWPEGRKLREILDMYQQAGRALAGRVITIMSVEFGAAGCSYDNVNCVNFVSPSAAWWNSYIAALNANP